MEEGGRAAEGSGWGKRGKKIEETGREGGRERERTRTFIVLFARLVAVRLGMEGRSSEQAE